MVLCLRLIQVEKVEQKYDKLNIYGTFVLFFVADSNTLQPRYNTRRWNLERLFGYNANGTLDPIKQWCYSSLL